MEPSSWPENLPSNRRKAIQELVQGRDLTNQLRMMLGQSMKPDPAVSVDDLVVKIMATFTDSLSILNSCNSNEAGSRTPASVRTGSPISDGRKTEGSGESSKTSAPKNRRGCYKRRKVSEPYTKITPTLVDDGYAWRKYGQKEILNATHQRNYYRCTHKYDQGCPATKQVQKTEDEPPKYKITYNGHHTCRNLRQNPQIILESPSSRDSSILLSFERKPAESPYYPSVPMKQENDCFKKAFPTNLKQDQSSESDYLSYHNTAQFKGDAGPGPAPVTSDLGEVISSEPGYSCTASTHSNFEMDMMMGSVDFDDLQFEFCS